MFASAVGRLSKRASIAKNARSSKKAKEAKEDDEDEVHYLHGVDEDDDNEESVDDEESAELEEAIEQVLDSSNSAWSFINNALQSEPGVNSNKKREENSMVERNNMTERVIEGMGLPSLQLINSSLYLQLNQFFFSYVRFPSLGDSYCTYLQILRTCIVFAAAQQGTVRRSTAGGYFI